LLAALSLALLCAPGAAQDPEFKLPRALKVCDDPNNLPFSNERGEGYENKIAALLARKLGLSLEVFHYPQRINVVRNTLRYKLPGQSEYRCDLLTGVPAELSAVAATRPYYRSAYALVYAKGGKLAVSTAEEFLALDPQLLATLKIGVYERTPPVQWLLKHNLLERAVPYRLLNADAGHYPGKIIEEGLIPGKLDAVLIWGPIGGYFAKKSTSPELIMVPLKSEPGVPLDFGVAMGVRNGESAWRNRIQATLDDSREEIDQLLREYGVLRVDEKGDPIP
jgi:mxaJ protein